MSSSTILSDNGVTSGSAGIKSTGGSDGTLLLQTTTAGGSATTAVTVDNAQNVGVGTSSPSSYNSGYGSQTVIANAGGNAGATIVTSTSGNGSIYFADGSSGDTQYRGFIQYAHADDSLRFASAATERMRIDSSGNLLVGKTITADTTVGGLIQATGRITGTLAASTNSSDTLTIYSTGASAYRFYVGMGGTVYATSTTISSISDIRFKENVRDLNVGLAEVMALKPRLYDWKEGKGADIKNARGFIAQEFEEVFPDLIDEWRDPAPEGEDPYKSVRQDLIPVLVKALQELKAELDTAKEQIAALQGAAK